MPELCKFLTRGIAIAAIAAVAGFGAMTLGDTSALAAHGGGHGGGGGGGHGGGHGGMGGGHGGGHAGFVGHGGGGGHHGGGRVIVRGGGGRHFWHGRWWGPGIGPCWRWTPLGWVWICG